MARLLQIAIGFAISALAIYLLLQQVSVEQLKQVLGQTQPLPLALVAAGVLAALVTRAARWQVYFRPQRRVRFRPLLETLAISYMASTFLPLRAGELVRAVFLGQRESIPVPRIVGTILLEKLFDFLAIGVMLGLLVTLTPLPAAALVASTSIVGVILVGFGFVVGLALWRAPTLRLVGSIDARLPWALGRRLHLEDSARQFAEGTDSLRVPELWVPLLGWTVVTWAFSLLTAWAGCLSLGINPGLPALLFLIVLTSSGQAVPSSPGYIGVYQGLVSVALTTLPDHVDAAQALGVGLITWAFTYPVLVVAGLIGLVSGGYSVEDVLSAVRGSSIRQSQSAPLAAEHVPLTPDP